MNTTELAAYKTQKRIGVDKNQKWANTPTEQIALFRKLYRDHLNYWQYDKPEIKLLIEIFDMQVNESNIKNFMSLSMKDFYTLLINDKLN